MPFLNRINKWAELRPDETAVAVDGRGFTWAELRGAAEELLPLTPETYILDEPNSVEFAALYCAGIAGGRQVAVLDPSWPPQMRHEIVRKLPAPERADETTLEDGDPESTFLVGFTAGTTAIPKAFTRSRSSWQASFEASIESLTSGLRTRPLLPDLFQPA